MLQFSIESVVYFYLLFLENIYFAESENVVKWMKILYVFNT